MKKKSFFLLIINILFLSNVYSNDYVFKQINLTEQSELFTKIYENYGNLWIGYKKSDQSFIKYGEEHTPIALVELYYKKSCDYVYLGKITIEGIYDKKNNLICKNILFKDRFKDIKPLGFMEYILDDPFYTGQYYSRDEASYGALEPYAFLSVDFAENTIKVEYLSN